MTRVFVHKATRVIRRLSLDLTMAPLPDEDALDLPGEWDCKRNGVYWKLGAGNVPEPATEQEVDDSDVDDVKVGRKQAARRKAVMDAIDAICDATPPTMALIKDYFQALRRAR